MKATEVFPQGLPSEERLYAEQNRSAVVTMWTGLWSILCLLLSGFLGSFRRGRIRPELAVLIMAALLIVSVILFFAAGKKDDRWYLLCTLLNHSGVGLAVLLLLDLLGLELRPLQIAISGLPAAAILFGVVLFYMGSGEESRNTFLSAGIVLLVLICGAALYRYTKERTEFWICMAVCALLCTAGLGALIWANRDPEERSILKGLAVASFSVYLLIAAAAVVFLLAGAGGSSGSRSSSRKRNSSKSEGSSGSRRGSVLSSFGSGLSGTRSGTTVRRRRSFYLPSYLWYYTPMPRYSAIDRMEGLSEEERQAKRRRYKILRAIVLSFVALIVILAIYSAVRIGRS